jgi:hypothetical protein
MYIFDEFDLLTRINVFITFSIPSSPLDPLDPLDPSIPPSNRNPLYLYLYKIYK